MHLIPVRQIRHCKRLFSFIPEKAWMMILFFIIFLTTACMQLKTENELVAYEKELNNLQSEFGGTIAMPDVKFFLFGMGNRTKIIYKNGILKRIQDGEIIERWDVSDCIIIPSEYIVKLRLSDGSMVSVYENETGVWINKAGEKTIVNGTSNPVILPDFKEYRYGRVMKVLHHEILINILDSKPLPNFLVYKNPWRRDGAMMAMCLKSTGNINLIKKWVLTLDDPFDRNNAGETEADNLGQTLYLLSFFTDKSYPLVQQILNEAKRFEVTSLSGKYIKGRSDFHETPVYQTKWLKFGLKSLDLPDDYVIPDISDDYSALFWWDYTDSYYKGSKDADDRENYPYLGWACDHFHKTKKSPVSNRIYPLTWEINASQADYSQMIAIDSSYVTGKNASPHTWHSAELFLYLLELKK